MSTFTGTTFTGQAAVAMNCWCGLHFAVPESLHAHYRHQNAIGKEFSLYCPLGHAMVPRERSNEERLKRELSEERERRERAEREARYAEQRAAAERSASKGAAIRAGRAKAALARAMKRIGAGVCPCCNRTFSQLARHMKAKHPDAVREVSE